MRDAPLNAQLHMLMLKTCVWGDPPLGPPAPPTHSVFPTPILLHQLGATAALKDTALMKDIWA